MSLSTETDLRQLVSLGFDPNEDVEERQREEEKHSHTRANGTDVQSCRSAPHGEACKQLARELQLHLGHSAISLVSQRLSR